MEEELQQLENVDQRYHGAFKEGLISYKAGDFFKSIESFKFLVQNYPDNPDGYINLGNAQYKIHNYDEAIYNWQKAKEIDTYLINSYINLGNAYFQQKRIAEALTEWETALMINPFSSTVLINLATTYEKIGNKKRAFKYYEFFLENVQDKTTSDYRNILKKISQHKIEAIEQMKRGIAFQKKNFYRKAVQSYMTSIEIYPNFAKGYLNLGNVCYKLNKYQNAVEYWLESYRLDREQATLCLNLAINYEKLRQYVDAYCFYERYVRKIGKSTVDVINTKRRIKKIDEIVRDRPKMIIEYREESEAILGAKKLESALIRFENLFLVTKDDDVFETMNDIRMKTDPILKAAEFAFECGKKYKQEGKIEKSINAFKRCRQLWPDSFFADEATQMISECGRVMGGAISAIMRSEG